MAEPNLLDISTKRLADAALSFYNGYYDGLQREGLKAKGFANLPDTKLPSEIAHLKYVLDAHVAKKDGAEQFYNLVSSNLLSYAGYNIAWDDKAKSATLKPLGKDERIIFLDKLSDFMTKIEEAGLTAQLGQYFEAKFIPAYEAYMQKSTLGTRRELADFAKMDWAEFKGHDINSEVQQAVKYSFAISVAEYLRAKGKEVPAEIIKACPEGYDPDSVVAVSMTDIKQQPPTKELVPERK